MGVYFIEHIKDSCRTAPGPRCSLERVKLDHIFVDCFRAAASFGVGEISICRARELPFSPELDIGVRFNAL